MRHKLFVFFTFITIVLSAQDIPLLYSEDFNSNKFNWDIHENSLHSAKISEGFFILTNNVNRGYIFTTEFEIDQTRDYIIETRLKTTEMSDAALCGLVFGIDEPGNGIYYLISPLKYCLWRKQVNWKFGNPFKKTTSTINPLGEFNTLKLKKTQDSFYFYVNNQFVKKIKIQANIGNYFGFALINRQKIKVDYFKIYGHDLSIINEVKNPISDSKINLGENINTEYTEILPIISPDGKTLYFVRNLHDSKKNIDGADQEIWFSKYINNEWSKAQKIGSRLNNDGNNAVLYSTADNNTLILNGKYSSSGEYVGRGISITHKQKNNSWSIPKIIKIDSFINQEKYINLNFSTDLQTLIISTTWKAHSYGKSDIYVSFRKSDGSYSAPKNIGPTINSLGNEGTPFIAADKKTLYFYSDGWNGYGQADVFVSKRLDDTWTNWTTPLNLGPNINSEANEAYFTIDAKGEYAYMISTKNSIGREDIFRIKLQEETQPNPVVLIYGKVLDSDTKLPLKSKISYDNLNTNTEVGAAISNEGTGEYKIILPYGNNYGFFAAKNGYMSLNDNIDLTNISEYTEIERNLYLVPIAKNEKIEINNLFFAQAKAQILPSSYPELDRIVLLMKNNLNLKIEIQGYTNNIGDKQKLKKLSEERAISVKNYLINKGISEKRIKTKGYGAENPIASNDTPEGRKKNQRVEIKILEK